MIRTLLLRLWMAALVVVPVVAGVAEHFRSMA